MPIGLVDANNPTISDNKIIFLILSFLHTLIIKDVITIINGINNASSVIAKQYLLTFTFKKIEVPNKYDATLLFVRR